MRRARRALDGLDDDIRDHIERETQDNIDRGMPPDEAHRQAMLKFGSVALAKEDTRAVWVWQWLEHLLQDGRYAIRTLHGSPGYAAVAVLTLALGIGANTAIFSIVNAVLLQPLPYPDASRLFAVYEQHPAPVRRTRLSAENFLDLQRETRSFEALGGHTGSGFTLSGRGEPEFVHGEMISAQLLDALGVQPLVGRLFHLEENEGGRDQVMLLSQALWQRRYGADPGIIGQTIIANGKPYTVIGIMPAGFQFPNKEYGQLWVPFAFRNSAQGLVNRKARFMKGNRPPARRGLAGAGAGGADDDRTAPRAGVPWRERQCNDAYGVAHGGDCGRRAQRARAHRMCGRIRPADRVRQCNQPASGTCVDARTRDCRSHGPWRQPPTSRAAAAHRNAGAVWRRCRCRLALS